MSDTGQRKKVLFLCTHNSARSQMAEGILRSLYGDRFEAFSAGTNPTAVNPLAVIVLSEIGIDISHSRSKNVSEFVGREIDYVVTLCNDAAGVCPFFPGGKEYIHHGFDDPADTSGSGNALSSFRRVRDEIKEWTTETFGHRRTDDLSKEMSFEYR